MRGTYILLASLMVASPAFACACDLVTMPITGSTGTLGGVNVAFGDADNAQRPTAWQGPLKISVGTSSTCTVSDDVAIVEKPVLLGHDILFVPTYSGSTNIVYAVNVKTCNVLWRSQAFTGPTSYKDNKLTIGASYKRLDVNCRPEPDKK